MNKGLRLILFWIVLLITTLHAIVSHPHSEVLSFKAHIELHKKSNSLIGIIRLVFYENNDEALDNLICTGYVSNNNRPIKNLKKYFSSIDIIDLNVQKIQRIEPFKKRCVQELLLVKYYQPRGPPLLI